MVREENRPVRYCIVFDKWELRLQSKNFDDICGRRRPDRQYFNENKLWVYETPVSKSFRLKKNARECDVHSHTVCLVSAYVRKINTCLSISTEDRHDEIKRETRRLTATRTIDRLRNGLSIRMSKANQPQTITPIDTSLR